MSNEDLISSLYPPPPPYVKYFTTENLNRLDAWKAEVALEQQKNDTSQQETQNHDKNTTKTPDGNEKSLEEPELLPPGELRFLLPPNPPSGTHYRGYGNIWSFEDKLPSLKQSNWEQLYQDNDESITSDKKIQELHKLMDSLLLNFLELIGIVSIDPSKFEPKIKNISLILININHLLNTYRPHQSRESLIMLLKKKIDAKRMEIENMDKVSSDIKSRIKKLVNIDELNYDDNSRPQETEISSDSIKDDIIEKFLQQI